MLSNAYFVAKFRFDTAENEPAKNLQNFRKNLMHFSKMHFRKMQGVAAKRHRQCEAEVDRERPRLRARTGAAASARFDFLFPFVEKNNCQNS